MEVDADDRRPRLNDIAWFVGAMLLMIGLTTWKMMVLKAWTSTYHAMVWKIGGGVWSGPAEDLKRGDFPDSLKDWLWDNHSMGMWGIWGLSILTLLIGLAAAMRFNQRRVGRRFWFHGALCGMAGSLAFVWALNL